jgi:epoxyqueuosine reductase
VDTAPVLERYWAVQAGLGFVGSNAMLIHPRLGSFVFVALLGLNEEVSRYDQPLRQRTCSQCGRCVEACPTAAIVEPRVIDACKCIAYLTIEKPHYDKDGEEQDTTKTDTHGYIFGCDICQRACPYNQKSSAKSHADWILNRQLMQMTATDWRDMKEYEFEQIAEHSPLKRAGLKSIKKIIGFF